MPLDDNLLILEFDAQDKNCSHIPVINTNSEDIVLLIAQPDVSLNTPPMKAKIVVEQSLDKYYKSPLLQVGETNTEFQLDDRELLRRKSIIDSAIRNVVPEPLRNRILYISHFLLTAEHPGQYKMYDTLRCSYYLPHMSNDEHICIYYTTVAKCASYVGNGNWHLHRMKLFPATGPFEFVAMDILEPPPKTTQVNQHVLIISDAYSKLTRAIPTYMMTSAHIANLFLDHWIFPFGKPAYSLTDNGPQFVCKCLSSISGYLGLKHLANTFYHLQADA